MNLRKWAALDKSAQAELIRHWRYDLKDPERICTLARKAARALAGRLANVASVRGVTIRADSKGERMILVVSTSRRQKQAEPAVPNWFASFEVRQEGMAERKLDYIRRVRFVLDAASVSDNYKREVLEELGTALDVINSVYYTLKPEHWIAAALVNGIVGELSDIERVRLQVRLTRGITEFYQQFPTPWSRRRLLAARKLRELLDQKRGQPIV